MAISKDDIVERNFCITNNNAIDMHVGKRVRLRRTLLGMSPEQLGAEFNVTFQQVQKYERGANRISASRLWDISQIIDVPISYFFDDMSEDTMRSSPRWISRGDNADVLNGEQIKDQWRGVKRWNWCKHITPPKSQRYASGSPKW